ncbi:hypothetical protein [Kribbella sp. VKM Ac-2568]|uniref:hypothetical protein n=1 Tax=Kribbella sp. VKM Ac-2568 TaxID=2512219 RepID=UPI001053438E|nr:hypothetical protein [Kribbella sp. VKM Ac-2568]
MRRDQVHHPTVSTQQVKRLREDGANILLYKQLFNAEYCASRPVAATRELVPDLLDFAGWLERYGAAIPR